MLKINELFSALDERAPLEYSLKYIERGDYDNSGIIVESKDEAEKILFSLDLSEATVKKAAELGCDTIVTHHPAIYSPIKRLSVKDDTAPLLFAIKRGLNVVSMHLNLDAAEGGIDASLCEGLGGKTCKILEPLAENVGYGREFEVSETTFSDFVKNAEKVFNTDKITAFGDAGAIIKTAACFCGAGAGSCVKYIAGGGVADAIVTSDMPHHAIKLAIESGKCVMLLTHYASENYGFKKYYERITEDLGDKAQTFFFADERFM